MKLIVFAAAFGIAALAGTAHAEDLTIEFTDPAWTGDRIPDGQHCKKFGGNGSTPPLKVSGIPAEADAIVVEFNDKSFGDLSYDGGHGKIGFRIEAGLGEAMLPAVPGGTDEMPDGVWLERKNRATGAWRSPGYLPPCSGGRGNIYEAEVYAVKMDGDDDYDELAEGEIRLGRY
jgi:hypothetical protein